MDAYWFILLLDNNTTYLTVSSSIIQIDFLMLKFDILSKEQATRYIQVIKKLAYKSLAGSSATYPCSSNIILTQFWYPLWEHIQVLKFILHAQFSRYGNTEFLYFSFLFFFFFRMYSLDWFFWLDYFSQGLHKQKKPSSGHIYFAVVFLF